MSAPHEAPNPGLIFDAFNAYLTTNALTGAIELDLFTAIGEGNQTASDIAKRVQANERGVRILCDFLTCAGFLLKDSDLYLLTADSALFLDRRSPACMASMSKFLAGPSLRRHFDDVAAVVRKGGTVASAHGTVEDNNPIWVDFARSMTPMMEMSSQSMAAVLRDGDKPCKVLDIAAGHGLFGIAIAQHNPNAEIVALDWEAVLEVAKENAKHRGVADRYSTIAGSAFDAELGSGYDLVLLTNFLHHFDPATNEGLLRRIKASLNPGGRVATLEMVPNDDRVTPPVAARFSMMMLGTTAAGDAFTFREFETMFQNAGFSHSVLHELPPGVERLIVSTV